MPDPRDLWTSEAEIADDHSFALEATIGPPTWMLEEWVAEDEAINRAEGAWLRWAETDSPFSQQCRAEEDADLRRCGEPGL